MLGPILIILLIVLLFILITAPFEALEWWADWFADPPAPAQPLVTAPIPQPDATSFIVYMTGIGSMEAELKSWRETQLFARLEAALPHSVLVNQIFPYSMDNRPLTGDRIFSAMWRQVRSAKLDKGSTLAGFMINIRNISQIIVSVDHRYGPIYNRGTAELVRRALANRGYPFDGDIPIFIIGYSGGGQIATGIVPYLKQWLTSRVYVVSLGGVFGSSRGHVHSDGFYHIVGKRDRIERLGWIFFPRRWPIWRQSHWNRAVKMGKVKIIRNSALAHTGRRAYIDPKSMANDERTYLDETVEIIAEIVRENTTADSLA